MLDVVVFPSIVRLILQYRNSCDTIRLKTSHVTFSINMN